MDGHDDVGVRPASAPADRSKRWLMVVSGTLLSLYVLFRYGGWIAAHTLSWVLHVASMAASLLAGLACLRSANKQGEPNERWAWSLFGLGGLSWFLGAVWHSCTDLSGNRYGQLAIFGYALYLGLPLAYLTGGAFQLSRLRLTRLALRQSANLLLLILGCLALFVLVFDGPLRTPARDPMAFVFTIVYCALYASAFCLFAGIQWLHGATARRAPLVLLGCSLGIHAGAAILQGYAHFERDFDLRLDLPLLCLLAFGLQYWAALEQEHAADWDLGADTATERFRKAEALLPALVLGVVLITAFGFSQQTDTQTVAFLAPAAGLFILLLGVREWQINLTEGRLGEGLAHAHLLLQGLNSKLSERIRECEQAEAQLRESEERFKTLCDSSAALVWMADQEGRCTYVNRVWRELTGGVLDEQIEFPWIDVVHPGDRDHCLKAYGQTFCTQQVMSVEYRVRSPDGSYRWLLDRAAPRYGPDGALAGFIGGAVDITERKDAEARITQLAYFDSLTGLPNRTLFLDRLGHALAHAERYGEELAVLFIDFDRIKTINDTLGHGAGDAVLREAGRRLLGALREDDTCGRHGGDEFMVLLPRIRGVRDAAHVAEKVLTVLAQSFEVLGQNLHLTASIGISIYPRDGRDPETLTKHADVALHRAKYAGRNTYRLFSPEMNAQAHERLTLENQLRGAVDRGELVLHYQPQLDVRLGCMSGMEALLRWRHPDLGLVSPMDFIPLAEETGLIVPIGRWVMATACRDAQEWRHSASEITVAVNVSARQFAEGGVVQQVEWALGESGLPPERLEIEVTETAVMQDIEHAARTLTRLKAIKVQLALDDFGAGYSSLGYLMRYPFDRLKIDRMFIQDVAQGSQGRAIVEAMLNMARALRLEVTAEGVETPEQLEVLQALGCHSVQGYLLGRPESKDGFGARLGFSP